MRVTYVANRLNTDAGGVDLSLALMARSIAERDHDVRVITLNTDDENQYRPSVPYDVVERSVDYTSRIELASTLYDTLEEFENRTDVYHVFEPAFISIAGFYRRRGGNAAVVGRLNAYTLFCTNLAKMNGKCHENCTVVDKFVHERNSLHRKVLRTPQYLSRTHLEPRLVNGVDRLFAISPTVGEAYQYNGVDEDVVEVVPNFYDPDFARTANERGDEVVGPDPTEKTRLLFVGRLEEIKGVDILVRAVAHLERDDIVLDIVGDGDRRETLAGLVDDLDIGDCVTFHGWVTHENLGPYYDAGDIFVHPGRLPEPFGRTLLEALQFDCPLVVSDVGAPPWVAGDAGETFPRGDHVELARTLESLLDDPEKRRALERNCSDRCRTFSPDRVLDRVEEYYADIARSVSGTL